MNKQDFDKIVEQLWKYRVDILFMVRELWGLTPQPVKPEYQAKWNQVRQSAHDEWEMMKNEVGPEWFGDYDATTKEWKWYSFEKGKHITWQQTLILLGVRKAANGLAKTHLTIVSGHGTGKSTTCSWILIWYLLVYHQSQVAATAPTSHQMHDVLWKEASIWLNKIKDESIRHMFVWQNGYIRMNVSPESWFARARTASKENPEALAGIHADNVLLIIDEASGVYEQIFNTAEGALTSGSTMVVQISNGTRTSGYFYDSHHKNCEDWQTFTFNGEESPMVDKKYVDRQAKRHGTTSDEYGIRVLGIFPREDAMDDSGYLQLTPASRVTVQAPAAGLEVKDLYWFGRIILGIDPSGEGKDKASFVLRDRFKTACVLELQTTNDKEIAARAIEIIIKYKIKPGDVVIDAFGIGARVGQLIALHFASEGVIFDTYSILVGNHPVDEEKLNPLWFRRKEDEVVDDTAKDGDKKDLFLNIRALTHFRASKWLKLGGTIIDHNVENSDFKEEVAAIKYIRSMQGNKIQLMSKKEMLKRRIKSPNKADALSLTFARDIDDVDMQSKEEREMLINEENSIEDPFAIV